MRVSSTPSRLASRATVVPWRKAAASPLTASQSDGIPTASPPSTDSAASAVVSLVSALVTDYSSASMNRPDWGMLATISSFPLPRSRSLPLHLINGGRSPVCGGPPSPMSGGTDRTGQQLGDVDDLQRVRGVARALLRGDGVAEHDQA